MSGIPTGRSGVPEPPLPPRPDRAELFAAETRPFFAIDDPSAGKGSIRESGARTVVSGDGDKRWEVASLGLEYRADDGVLLVVTRMPSDRDPAERHLRSDMANRLGLAAAEAQEGEAYVDGPAMWARVDVATAEADRWQPAELVLDGAKVPGWRSCVGRYSLTYVVPDRGGVVFELERGWGGPTTLASSTDYGQLERVPEAWT